MSIIVVCPGCRKRFKVNEKFAGKTGPCPKCKHPIAVPAKSEEFKLHTPEEFGQGGRNPADQLVLKPLAREQFNFNPITAAIVTGVAALIFVGASLGGKMGLFKDDIFTTAAGLVLISPLLALAGYSFLYDEELAHYKGISLFIRSAICGLIYALLWGVFAYVSELILTGEIWNWVFIAPPFMAVGAMVAVNTLDLEFGNGFFHYSFYLLVTIILRWAMGMDWIWNIK